MVVSQSINAGNGDISLRLLVFQLLVFVPIILRQGKGITCTVGGNVE